MTLDKAVKEFPRSKKEDCSPGDSMGPEGEGVGVRRMDSSVAGVQQSRMPSAGVSVRLD